MDTDVLGEERHGLSSVSGFGWVSCSSSTSSGGCTFPSDLKNKLHTIRDIEIAKKLTFGVSQILLKTPYDQIVPMGHRQLSLVHF